MKKISDRIRGKRDWEEKLVWKGEGWGVGEVACKKREMGDEMVGFEVYQRPFNKFYYEELIKR